MGLFLRQIITLIWKNILIVLIRHPLTTPLRCLLLTVVYSWFISYARNFFIAPSTYGIGQAEPILPLQTALSYNTGRDILALVNNGNVGGDIDTILKEIGDVGVAAGKDVQYLDDEDQLLITCRSTLRGTSNCFAALVFYSSPLEGDGQLWNYTLRVDGSLGGTINAYSNSNDQEIFILPLQQAVDNAIVRLNSSTNLPAVEEYPYTSITQDQRNIQIRTRYNTAIITILGVALFIGICPVLYQQVGLQAVERETGISQLLESMMPNKRRWQPQAARLIAYHIAFSAMFAPGWIIMGIIFKVGIFANTNAGIVIVFHLLTGLSLASWSLFIGAFFRRAQLSGITAIILSLVLAVIAQVYDNLHNGAVAVCSLLFPSMNYVWFAVYMARYESNNYPTDMIHAAPGSPWTISGIVLWVFLILQILIYPILAALVERFLWGTASVHPRPQEGFALELNGFSKHYYPTWLQNSVGPLFGRAKKEVVLAADDLNLAIRQGHLVSLIGANGSGKSTTLDAVSGLSKPTSGTIKVDSSQGIGMCPQKNVHWPLLTVYEHVNILNKLKLQTGKTTRADNLQLIKDCDLDRKVRAKAKSLSGGQQRKLQLAMMFTGGSRLCLVDEVSSGIDPLARRKIQEILLAERSKRTIVFTSHFLDEADIADQVVIMSKGRIRIDGTGPQVKSEGLYRVHLHHGISASTTPEFPGVDRLVRHDQTVYTVSSAAEVTSLLAKVEASGWHEYHVAGPTIEDAFLQVAEEMVPEVRIDEKGSDSSSEKELSLQSGSHVGPFRQGLILFRKRWTVFRRNWIPNTTALLVVPIAAGLVTLFIASYPGAGCSPTDTVTASDIQNLTTQIQNNLDVVVGPASKLNFGTVALITTALGLNDTNGTSGATGNTTTGTGQPFSLSNFTQSFHLVNDLDSFNDYILQHRRNVTPGGAFFGENETTMAFKGNGAVFLAFLINNIVNIINSNIPIAASYSTFDIPWQADQGSTLQFCVYLGLVMCMYPAFFALYPTLERLRNVRGLHYSNGVRALPLWLAYTIFDLQFILVGSAVAIAIFAGINYSIFWSLGHLFVVFVLYGLCATLFAYVISLYARSQLAAFAVAAAYQAVSLLLYMIAYLSVFTYAPINKVDDYVLLVHYTITIIFPSGSLMRSFFVSLNELSVNCRGPNVYASSPAEFQAYGAPITYLIIQSLFLFGYLVWWDHGARLRLRRKYKDVDAEGYQLEPDVAEELKRVESSNDDGLKVLHLTKAFGSNVAVRDVSFGIKRGEVFALLGPNGAGKSTTVSCIRGDLIPSSGSGDITIEGVSMLKKKAAARQLLGNCPQFDAMDQLTVLEHLRFYARIRGVKDVEANVQEIIRGVGLTAFKNRMGNALSGGNKRKLSLGIALMGNPAVMLLDEISSGLDVAAKRILWKTLETVVPGRSIALITHSMEEADRLCRRAGIMAQKMLAIGTVDDLRRKHGNRYHVHVLLNSAPYTTDEESERVLDWVRDTFEHAEADEKAFHGQVRFSVPVDEKAGGIARLFRSLEDSKKDVGFEYYSVAQTTLEDVFLRIVAKHNVEEENYRNAHKKRRWWKRTSNND